MTASRWVVPTLEERSQARARALRAAGVSWAEAALAEQTWWLEHDEQGRTWKIHTSSCSSTRTETREVSCSILELGPLTAFCRCVGPTERDWWQRANGLHRLYRPLALVHDLRALPRWESALSGVTSADRLLQARRSLGGADEEALVGHCVREAERARAAAETLVDARFRRRAEGALAELVRRSTESWDETLEVLAQDHWEGTQTSRREVVLGLPHVLSDPVAALVTLVRPVLATEGTRRIVVVTEGEAELLSRNEGRSSTAHDGSPPEVWETTLWLWDPWGEGELKELEHAHRAALGVHA